jgi:hypothetical protein
MKTLKETAVVAEREMIHRSSSGVTTGVFARSPSWGGAGRRQEPAAVAKECKTRTQKIETHATNQDACSSKMKSNWQRQSLLLSGSARTLQPEETAIPTSTGSITSITRASQGSAPMTLSPRRKRTAKKIQKSRIHSIGLKGFSP